MYACFVLCNIVCIHHANYPCITYRSPQNHCVVLDVASDTAFHCPQHDSSTSSHWCLIDLSRFDSSFLPLLAHTLSTIFIMVISFWMCHRWWPIDTNSLFPISDARYQSPSNLLCPQSHIYLVLSRLLWCSGIRHISRSIPHATHATESYVSTNRATAHFKPKSNLRWLLIIQHFFPFPSFAGLYRSPFFSPPPNHARAIIHIDAIKRLPHARLCFSTLRQYL